MSAAAAAVAAAAAAARELEEDCALVDDAQLFHLFSLRRVSVCFSTGFEVSG